MSKYGIADKDRGEEADNQQQAVSEDTPDPFGVGIRRTDLLGRYVAAPSFFHHLRHFLGQGFLLVSQNSGRERSPSRIDSFFV